MLLNFSCTSWEICDSYLFIYKHCTSLTLSLHIPQFPHLSRASFRLFSRFYTDRFTWTGPCSQLPGTRFVAWWLPLSRQAQSSGHEEALNSWVSETRELTLHNLKQEKSLKLLTLPQFFWDEKSLSIQFMIIEKRFTIDLYNKNYF